MDLPGSTPPPPNLNKWPSHVEGQQSVVDRYGVIWLLVPEYNGGIATTATASGVFSVGINMLRRYRWPLHILKLDQNILDQFPTIAPAETFTEPIQEVIAVTEQQARGLNS